MPCDCLIPPGTNLQDPIRSEVNQKDRKWNNRIFTVVFAAVILVQMILAAVLIATASSSLENTSQCEADGGQAYQDTLVAERAAEAAGEVASELSKGFEKLLVDYLGTAILAIFLILLIGTVWIFGLQKAAPVIVWGTLGGELIAAVGLAIWLLVEEIPEMAIFILVVAFLAGLVMFFKRTAVFEAAQMLQNAAYCVQANPSIIGMAVVLQIGLFSLQALAFAGMGSSFAIGTWKWISVTKVDLFGDVTITPDCVYLLGGDNTPGWVGGSRYFISLAIGWVFFSVAMLRTYMAGGTAALWYWHDDQDISWKACKVMRWGLSTGFGTVAICGLILAIMDKLNDMYKSKVNWCLNMCNPIWWFFVISMRIFKEMINALTKFTVIISVITGDDFFVSAGRTYYTLKGRFSTLFVVDGVGKIILYSGAFVFSGVVFFLCWMIAAATAGQDPFAVMAHEDQYMIKNILFWILGLLLMLYPLAGIIFVVFLSDWLGEGMGYPWAFAVFIGAIANFMFSFFADVMLDIVASMFVLVEIDKKNGRQPAGAEKVGSPGYVASYYLKLSDEGDGNAVQMNTVQATPVAIPVAVAVPNV